MLVQLGATRAKRPSARHDPDFRALLRIHLAAPSEESPSGAASRLLPAAFCGFLDLEAVRHDYPLVLCEGSEGPLAVPLARLLDGLAERAEEGERDAVRRALYRLELEIKRLAAACAYGQLSELWARAVDRLLEAAPEGEARTRLGERLRAARAALEVEGAVIGCAHDSARKLFAHGWDRLLAEQSRRERASLERLIAAIQDILDADKARSPRATSPQVLRAALGGEHAGGIDFERMATLLRTSKHHRPLTPARRKRLREVLKVLDEEHALLARHAGNGARRRSRRKLVTTTGSCSEALSLFQAEIYRMVTLVRAVRIARLEVENRYQEGRHDAFFEAFGPDHLTPEERRALPPLMVYLDGDSMTETDRCTLLDILASDLPIKVLLEVTRVPGGVLPAPGPTAVSGWLERLPAMAATLEGAFVLQAPVSHLPALAGEIAEGLRFEGPALFAVYTGPREPREDLPPYLRTAAAVESRAYPVLVSAPGRGARWAERFSLAANPAPEADWPEHRVSYEDAEGRLVEEPVRFTYVDFLACDPRFAGHFVPVGRGAWHPDMMPVADYLALGEDDALGKVPYILMSDAEGAIRRVVVRRGPIAAARRARARWRSLRELAGIESSHVEQALARERERLEAELREELAAAVPAAAPAAAPASPAGEEGAGDAAREGGAEEQAAPAETSAERDPDETWIETEMCTACNDCVDRNGLMFGYNEAKQAYIKDLTAGTYRELIEAAENCPVCIIHPGKPWNPAEPGLEELLARAAAL